MLDDLPGSVNRSVSSSKVAAIAPPAPTLAAEPERKRTRGVECSIAKAMALKEKRSSIGAGPQQLFTCPPPGLVTKSIPLP